MAKKSSVQKNLKRQKLSLKYGNKRKKLKAIIYSKNSTMEEIFNAQLKLSELPRNSSTTRYRNRCKLTGRSRGVYSKFELSRVILRELASTGEIPGVIKSSW